MRIGCFVSAPQILLFIILQASLAGAASLPASAPQISYEGRTVTTPGGGIRLGYPGIVVRIRFRGPSLAMQTRTDSNEMYLDVSLDGAEPRCMRVPQGEGEVVLTHDLSWKDHRIEIVKRVESAVGVLDLIAFEFSGELLDPSPLPDRKLLFIGDSFTAGQAADVEDGGPVDPSKAKRENARLSYGRLLADRLHAQAHIIAYAGRGVMRDWQGIHAVRLAPEFYEYALPDDPTTLWDHHRYVPDAIGVCVGQNDLETIPDEVDYVNIYSEFVRKLRDDAPRAEIFLITAPSLADEPGKMPMHTIQRLMLEEVVARLDNPHIRVTEIRHYSGVPGDWHPSGTAHRAIADELEPVFRKALHWMP